MSEFQPDKQTRKNSFLPFIAPLLHIGLSVSPCRSLSCQRVSLHKNTFLSFILNSIVTMIWLSLSAANDQTMNTTNPVSHFGLFNPLATSTNNLLLLFFFFLSSLNLRCSPSPGQLQDADGAQPVHHHLQLLLDAVRRHLPPHAHHCGRLCGGAAALLVLHAGMGWAFWRRVDTIHAWPCTYTRLWAQATSEVTWKISTATGRKVD